MTQPPLLIIITQLLIVYNKTSAKPPNASDMKQEAEIRYAAGHTYALGIWPGWLIAH
jgi:hypothetical protein